MSLRERQEALVRALVADGPVPDGFDPDEVAAAGAVCRHKLDAHAHAAHAQAPRRLWWLPGRG